MSGKVHLASSTIEDATGPPSARHTSRIASDPQGCISHMTVIDNKAVDREALRFDEIIRHANPLHGMLAAIGYVSRPD